MKAKMKAVRPGWFRRWYLRPAVYTGVLLDSHGKLEDRTALQGGLRTVSRD